MKRNFSLGNYNSFGVKHKANFFIEIKNKDKNFHYVHVDHNLIDTSSKEAQILKKTLRKFKIECKIITWKKKTNTKKTQ